NAATMRLFVSRDGVCSADETLCVLPTGEVTAFTAWSAGGPGMWQQTLQPATADFQGRTVIEQDPGGGGPDTCHFPGSMYTPGTAITGGTWAVGAGNSWGADFVGWFTGAVTYYRAQGRAPCGT